jgi:protein SCO1/2
MTRWVSLAALGAILLAGAGPARGQGGLPRLLQKVGFDQRLGVQLPLDASLVDERGDPVKLGDYFNDRPVILVMAYYRCPMLCTLVLNGLVQGLMDVPFDAGKEYEIVVVSIDPRETPELASAKKKTYVERYGRPGAERGWHFLTASQDSIDRLTEAIGFHYVYDAPRDEYAHAAGLVMATPKGKLSHYFYDVKFSARDLRLALVESSQGTIGTPVDRILLYCFHYDPNVGKYGPAVMRFVRMGGVATMVSLVTLVGVLWWRDRRRHAANFLPAATLEERP